MGNQETRKRIIGEIKGLIVKSYEKKEILLEKKIISWLMFQHGYAERTAKEFINLLVNSEFCERLGDEIKFIAPKI